MIGVQFELQKEILQILVENKIQLKELKCTRLVDAILALESLETLTICGRFNLIDGDKVAFRKCKLKKLVFPPFLTLDEEDVEFFLSLPQLEVFECNDVTMKDKSLHLSVPLKISISVMTLRK